MGKRKKMSEDMKFEMKMADLWAHLPLAYFFLEPRQGGRHLIL